MSQPRKILLLTSDVATVATVGKLLQGDAAYAVEVCMSLPELGARIQQDAVAAALVDIDPSPLDILAELEPLARRLPGTALIAVASELRSEWILAAMKAGTRYFLAKSALAEDLGDVLRRLAPEPAPELPHGQGAIVTVLSCAGGCGATTLAINLADQLYQLSHKPSLLVDMDFSYGAVSHYLGVKAQYGLGDVLAHDDHIDAQLVRSTMAPHGDGLRVLASPGSFIAKPPVCNGQVPGVMEVFRQVADFTVLDAPRVTLDLAETLSRESRVVVLVFQLNVKDVRFAHVMLHALTERGLPADRFIPVANRTGHKHAMVSLADARNVLGVPVAEVRNDYASAIRSLNYGLLLSQTAPHSLLAKGAAALAGRVLHAAADTDAYSRGNAS